MEATPLEALDRLAGVLAGGGATVLASTLLGRTALGQLPALRGRLTEAEGWLLGFATGSALLSATVFALCALKLFFDGAVLLVSAAILGCWLLWGRWTWASRPADRFAWTRQWHLLLWLPAAAYGLLYAVHALAPETRSDAVGYHLGLVQRYYRNHGFLPITTNVYAQLSQGAEMLYLFAYSLGRESAAKMVHFSFLCATVAGIACIARRLRSVAAAVFAAVVFFSCPVVIPDATSAYNDCALAFTLTAVFCVLALWWHHGDWQWLVALGALVGFAFAIKYTGAVAGAAVVVAAAKRYRSHGLGAACRALAMAGAVAGAFALPWLVKNAVYTGNPVAPFFNAYFPNPYASVEWESAYRFAMKSYRLGPFDRWEQLLAAPFELALGRRYAGSLGWIVLLAPLALIEIRRPAVRMLLAAAAVCALPWLANAGARFLIPSMVFLGLAMGLALQRAGPRLQVPVVAGLLLAQCVTSWPAHRGLWYHPQLWSVEGFPWRAAMGLEPEKWHLARNLKHFLLADHLNTAVPKDSRILSFVPLPEAYFQAELLVSYQGLENQDLADALLSTTDPAERPDSALRTEWGAQPLRGVRVERTRSWSGQAWRLSEIRLLSGGGSIAPEPDWKLGADPLPWHAGRAFDGDPFTVWSSREPPQRGMALEARFADELTLDGAELIHPRSSSEDQVGLVWSGLSPDGEWEALEPTRADFVRLAYSSAAARSAAAAMLRRHRIRYVVFHLDPQDGYYPQTRIIASAPGAWGLRRVFADRAATLYEVLPDGP